MGVLLYKRYLTLFWSCKVVSKEGMHESQGDKGEMGDVDIGIDCWGLDSVMYTVLIWAMELLLFC